MERRFIYDKDVAVVDTKSGKVHGYIEDDVTVFKGIPYAHAKRFHRPETATWEGTFEATNYGFVCPLLTNDKPMGELLVPHRFWPQDEDCMNLNIWTPGLDDKKRPVMVWLHGGGFFAGSSIEQQAYEGGAMSHEGDVVVVSINHRLNILGYFDVSDFGEEYEHSGNAGMEDIIFALKWVRDNIAAFGGDPDNVTLFGQSGGGAKITTLLQMPEADGLFHKGINMSGVIAGLLEDVDAKETELAKAMMEDLGLSTIKQLEEVDFYLLAGSYNKLSPEFRKAGKSVGGAPHYNKFYAGDPLVHGFRQESADVALMVGSVFGEFLSFMPTPYDKREMTFEQGEEFVRKAWGQEGADKCIAEFKKAYPERNPVDLITIDTVFRKGEQQYILDRAKISPDKTFSYLFNADMPIDGGRTPWHCSDIPYVFHNTQMCPYTQETGVTDRLENQVFQSVMAFAYTGKPGNAYVPEWPACTQDTDNIMVFYKDQAAVRPDFDKELIPLVAENMKMQQMGNIQH